MNCDKKSNADNGNSAVSAKNITVFGGDGRALAAAEKFIRRGYSVTLCGFSEAEKYPKGARLCSSAVDALENADVILFPLPLTRDGVHVFCPYDGGGGIKLDEIIGRGLMKPTARVFGGKLTADFKNALEAEGIFTFDYLDCESLALVNAHATAEGALMYAMEATDKTVYGRNIAILGYGRIAERLCRLCESFGAFVTVFARREESRTLARLHGASAAPLTPESAKTLSHGYDIIFNTVPARIIPPDAVALFTADTLYIELASSPFGIDAADVRRSAARAIWASSIPGKYAPVTAGEMIADVVISTLGSLTSGGDGV
ncbi:MAG: hypothetical protein E7589_05810 [Ruminococcaceae bacterium]|nr:hypothetical protein [Oscillospiraceae bacterium]